MIEDLKKVDLHVHLDGSVNISLLSELSGLDRVEIIKNYTVLNKVDSLTEYLDKFDFAIKYMQTKRNLYLITKQLIEDLKKDNVIYAEIRMCPLKHTKEGLSMDEVVETVLEGLKSEEVKTTLILTMIRGFNINDNIDIIDCALKYHLPIDLAGDEIKYSNESYKKVFEILDNHNYNYTVHSGETNKDNVKTLLKYNTKRIGHGITIVVDSKLTNKVKKKQILLEVCPSSNLNTNVINTIKEHPIYDLYKYGVKVVICTDNRTVSNTTLNNEYKLLMDNFDFKIEDFRRMNIRACQYAFIDEETKMKLISKITG